jgi:hypothetical protein
VKKGERVKRMDVQYESEREAGRERKREDKEW